MAPSTSFENVYLVGFANLDAATQAQRRKRLQRALAGEHRHRLRARADPELLVCATRIGLHGALRHGHAVSHRLGRQPQRIQLNDPTLLITERPYHWRNGGPINIVNIVDLRRGHAPQYPPDRPSPEQQRLLGHDGSPPPSTPEADIATTAAPA